MGKIGSLKSFLFGIIQLFLSQMAHDYIVTNSININSSLIGSRCIPNGTHTNHQFRPYSNNIKTSDRGIK